MWDDGVVVPHPPIRRSLEMTKAALEKAGHKGLSRITPLPNHTHLSVVVDWKPIKHRLLADTTARNHVFIVVLPIELAVVCSGTFGMPLPLKTT
jgi:amidase